VLLAVTAQAHILRCPIASTVLHTVVIVMHKANHVQPIGAKWVSFSIEYQSSIIGARFNHYRYEWLRVW